MGQSPHRYKKIAFVSNNAWSVYNFRLNVIRALLLEGYEVLVMAPNDDFSALLQNEGCSYIPLKFNNKSANPFADLLFYFQLKRTYRKYAPDFIFHYVAKPNIYGSLAAASLKIPSVAIVTGLGHAFARKNLLYRAIKFLYKKALLKPKAVWFLNNEDARVFSSEGMVNIRKVKVLPGEGVDASYFLPQTKQEGAPFTFIMSTRLLKSKGIAVYADAARILRNKGYNWSFKLIGFFEKEHPDSISEEHLNKWQQEGLLFYEGYTRDVRSFIAQSDCFVLPSFYNEGVPRSLMEAASMALPIITTFNKGCREVVQDRVSGYLCQERDPFDLADKMEKMAKLPQEQRIEMGIKGRELVLRQFSVEKVVEVYMQMLVS